MPGNHPWELGAASGGLGRAGTVSLTSESPTVKGPVGLITVLTGLMLISAGAMFSPCIAAHALSHFSAAACLAMHTGLQPAPHT